MISGFKSIYKNYANNLLRYFMGKLLYYFRFRWVEPLNPIDLNINK